MSELIEIAQAVTTATGDLLICIGALAFVLLVHQDGGL